MLVALSTPPLANTVVFIAVQTPTNDSKKNAKTHPALGSWKLFTQKAKTLPAHDGPHIFASDPASMPMPLYVPLALFGTLSLPSKEIVLKWTLENTRMKPVVMQRKSQTLVVTFGSSSVPPRGMNTAKLMIK